MRRLFDSFMTMTAILEVKLKLSRTEPFDYAAATNNGLIAQRKELKIHAVESSCIPLLFPTHTSLHYIMGAISIWDDIYWMICSALATNRPALFRQVKLKLSRTVVLLRVQRSRSTRKKFSQKFAWAGVISSTDHQSDICFSYYAGVP